MIRLKAYICKLSFWIIPFITFPSCSKGDECNECKECELDPVTTEYNKNCSTYVTYCGDDPKNNEGLDIYDCK